MESGGAFYWNDVEPKYLRLTDHIFQDNRANIYGDNIGTFASALVLMNET